ncbi:DUF1549 and DUF1553 domain-containing protein [Fimbriiglobus ruber]|uniref:Translation initiation factor 2 n=1 Tax=Fimbriiglobus ruber TaxID=1908690 RepID=A0A225DIZ4_9BACT|nr:DUF1549 and DUF1553 domain-containing protein [Fimbriiglobus ruber]OWK36087.1 Translation initiation factor 2 [Fimbriiglobus ruber]
MRTLRTTLIVAAVCVVCPAVRAGVELPGGAKIETVDFERHVMGLLSKTGCNSGSCHGSFQGKNGFRLSLFGFEPTMDFAALTRDNLGRRVDTQHPENSLLLLKAVGATRHEGGMRFGKDAWTYNVFREWIRQGATWTPGRGAIAELSVSPPDFAVVKNGETLAVKVTATFTDGTREDVTPFCDFRVSDDAIATVSPVGVVAARQPGDAGLTVLYRGTVRAVRVLVPAPGKAPFPNLSASNTIDREVFAKLRLLNMTPSDLSGDAEFLRRVTIDTIGSLPTPAEVRAFVADTSLEKRAKKIDELLAHPLHAALWATKLSDITGNSTVALENPVQLQAKRSQLWHDWLRKRVADNQPYDQLARDILTATSRDDMTPAEWVEWVKKIDAHIDPNAGQNEGKAKAPPAAAGFGSEYVNKKTLDLFWRRQQNVPVEIWGEKVAAAFLGVRLECAQCHKHPTDRWTQEDYWGFANLFAPVTFLNNQFSSTDVKKLADEENKKRRDAAAAKNNQINQVREVYYGFSGRNAALRPIPSTKKVVGAKPLGGDEWAHKAGVDTRVKLWEWMHDPKNSFFARSFVNRVWAHYFGVGIVNPVDDFSQANPPTNPRLLDALAQEFIASGFDIRALERSVLVSRTYQLSSTPNESNRFDKNNYAHSYVRPLMAEQVVDVLNAAIGVDEQFANEAPVGKKMIEIGASRLNNGNLNYVLRIFGRPPRTTACDCERAADPALPQTLFRMTDPAILQKLRTPTNRAAKLARDKVADEVAVDELFLAVLGRAPTETEKSKAKTYVAGSKTKAEGYQDVLWALINTREFILNH